MKFNHILFPIDFSDRCRTLKPEVEALANKFGSKVTLLHVFEIPTTWYGTAEAPLINMECFQEIRDNAKENLRTFKLGIPEDRIERILGEGDPAGEIISWAETHQVDLIMMGTRGFGKLLGVLLGSVTSKVIHGACCPVWTDSCTNVPEGGRRTEIAKILCGVEVDDEATLLLRFAVKMGVMFKADVRIVHAIPEADTRPNQFLDFDLRRYLLENAKVELSKLQREAGTNFQLTLQSGDISTCLHEVALEERADLILIGRGKCKRAFGRLRTHAYQIIHEAPCPVLSYSPAQLSHTSLSYSAEHLAQPAEGEQLLIDSRRS